MVVPVVVCVGTVVVVVVVVDSVWVVTIAVVCADAACTVTVQERTRFSPIAAETTTVPG